MDSDTRHYRSFWLTLVIATAFFDALAIRATLLRATELGMNLFRSAWGGVLFLYLLVLAMCVGLFLHIIRGREIRINLLSKGNQPFFESTTWRAIGLVVFVALLFVVPLLKFSLRVGQNVEKPAVDPLLVSYFYYWFCIWILLFAAVSWKWAFKTSWPVAFISTLVIFGVIYEVWVRFGAVSTYPLSMGWSEGSRYYYASLYFSKWIYGKAIPLSTLHPTRYLLQSIPFLIPSLGLSAHRFWQFLLWIGLTAWAAIVIARRVAPQEKAAQWLIAGGLFLFLLRMGVYYHLEPMVILPIVFVSTKHPVRSLIAVIVASLWAGISRVNWFPMPAMIAAAIYLLETPFLKNESLPVWKQVISYLSLPVLWGLVGLTAALISQAVYIPLSGNAGNAEAFASSLSSDLLWYRLWPNPNHQFGILPATLLFSFPLIITIIMAARQWTSLHIIRWFGLFAMLLVLFAGSLVVSAKIGGGGDLHNMDTYAVMIGVVAAYFIGGQVTAESGTRREPVRSWAMLALVMLIPMVFLIQALRPRPGYHEAKNEQAYRTLKKIVNEAGKTAPVLLINERQFSTFSKSEFPLVADYEAVTLMEMAMSNNQTYLNHFYEDLRNHRFSVIVTNPQNLVIKEDGPLKEENNIWNTRVAPYILCYYRPSEQIQTDWNRIQVYIPNPETKNCP